MTLSHTCHHIFATLANGHITTSRERLVSDTYKKRTEVLLDLFKSIVSSSFICLQVWLHETIVGNVVTRNETICDGSGEDPTCSRYLSALHSFWHA